MSKRIREPFGKAGLTVAIFALVMALVGGAYAAENNSGGDATASQKKRGPAGLNAKQKREVRNLARNIAKRFQGSGPAGPVGAVGPIGPVGPQGNPGANGTNGTNGTSVTGVAATVGECPDGGVKYTSASGVNIVCNGADGEDGETGFTSTLPPGETLKGAWAYGVMAQQDIAYVPVSFSIPLGAAPTVHVIGQSGLEKEFPTGNEIEQPKCPGSVAEPTAEPGALCLYTGGETNVGFAYAPIVKSYNSGAVVPLLTTNTGSSAYGTWAVTAPEPS